MLPKNTAFDVLVTLSADLLAQVEARHRQAARLETGTRVLAQGARDRTFSAEQALHLRQLLETLRATAQNVVDLTAEYERELTALLQPR